ncbi:hypothetical protein KY317_03810, partial [Candidatus Woesearchaeota archaeon]|nr:hypothetical protein [Candidatus Woesearchaeota archaeon]
PGPSTYTQKTETNIDANCGAITPEFSIAFCHYDNYGFTSDGFTYDDITITYNQGSGAGVYSYDFTDTSQEGRYDVIEVWAEDSEGEETTENYNDIYFTAETPEPPVITNPVLDKTQVSQGESVRFSATITDSNGIDSARATIRYPNEDLIEENLNRYYIPPGQSDSTPQTCSGLWGSDCGVTCDTEEDNTFDDCNNCGGSYEHVDEVQIDATSVTAGTPIKVTCTFDPYDSSTGEYIWYYDAAAWHKLYSGYAPSGSIHDVSVDFTANNNLGTHAVRCIVVWAGTGTAPCQSNSGYYDHDDVTFLVVDSNNPVPTDIFYYDFTDTLQEGRYDGTQVWAEDKSGEQTTENYDDVYFMVS